MKIKELNKDNVCSYLKLDPYSELDDEDQSTIDVVMEAALSYICSYTGMTSDEVENQDDITIAYLCVCEDMYDNRAMQIEKNMLNNTVATILNMHSKNLI